MKYRWLCNYKIIILLLFLVPGFLVVAHAAKEKVSKPGELQKGLKIKRDSKLPKMPAKLKAPIKTPAKEKGSMEAVLLQQEKGKSILLVKPAHAAIMPPVTDNKDKGQGAQQSKKTMLVLDKTTSKSIKASHYLHIVLEVSKSGKAKVLNVTKVPGKLIVSKEVLGDYIYSAQLNNKILTVRSIPDPFVMRSFPILKEGATEGHHFSKVEKARVVIKVPDAAKVEKKLDRLTIKLFKLKPGKEIKTIDSKMFNKLRKSKRLKTIINVPSTELSQQIRNKLKKQIQ